MLLVDDHQVVRRGLRTFLELNDDIVVVGEAGDGLEGVELAARLEPDVVLMDIVMPRLDGIEATRPSERASAQVGMIALTSFAGDDQVLPALEAGASSYLLKDVTPEELVEAISAVHRGEPRLHPDALRKVMEAAMGLLRREPAAPAAAPPGELTERELEVVALVAQGLSNREIADASSSARRRSRPTSATSSPSWSLRTAPSSPSSRSRTGWMAAEPRPRARALTVHAHTASPPRRLGIIVMVVIWAALLGRTLGSSGTRQWPVYLAGYCVFLVLLLLVVVLGLPPSPVQHVASARRRRRSCWCCSASTRTVTTSTCCS